MSKVNQSIVPDLNTKKLLGVTAEDLEATLTLGPSLEKS